jgi:hypothetical protein
MLVPCISLFTRQIPDPSIQSGIVRKKLGFEARCYIIVIYLNVGYNIAIYLDVGTLIIDAINVKIQLSPWLTSSF